jgi:hypothetical protein
MLLNRTPTTIEKTHRFTLDGWMASNDDEDDAEEVQDAVDAAASTSYQGI